MSTHHTNVKLIVAAIAALLATSCGVDTQDAATPARAKLQPPAKIGPLKAAQLDALRTYDRNGNGELDVAETQRMESERKTRVEALRVRINSRYDRNGNGVLEPVEAHAMQADRDKLSGFKGAALRRYDQNHDGVLDPTERQRMQTERQGFLKDMNGKLLAKFDTDHDGKLDPQERVVMDHQLAAISSTHTSRMDLVPAGARGYSGEAGAIAGRAGDALR